MPSKSKPSSSLAFSRIGEFTLVPRFVATMTGESSQTPGLRAVEIFSGVNSVADRAGFGRRQLLYIAKRMIEWFSGLTADVLKCAFPGRVPIRATIPAPRSRGHGDGSFPSGEETLQASWVTPFILDYYHELAARRRKLIDGG